MSPPVPLPISPIAALLLGMLPGILACGWVVARWATKLRVSAMLLSPAIALALWVELAHLVGYLTHSFAAGMWTSTLLVGGAGWIGVLRRLGPRFTLLRRLWRVRQLRWMCTLALISAA